MDLLLTLWPRPDVRQQGLFGLLRPTSLVSGITLSTKGSRCSTFHAAPTASPACRVLLKSAVAAFPNAAIRQTTDQSWPIATAPKPRHIYMSADRLSLPTAVPSAAGVPVQAGSDLGWRCMGCVWREGLGRFRGHLLFDHVCRLQSASHLEGSWDSGVHRRR